LIKKLIPFLLPNGKRHQLERSEGKQKSNRANKLQISEPISHRLQNRREWIIYFRLLYWYCQWRDV